MASQTSGDPITPEPFWFLNPQLHRLASVELRFVAQWTDHEKPAQDWIRELLVRDWLPWWADIEVEELDDIQTVVRANRMTLVGPVRRWLWWKHDYPPIEWETSSSIYIGPSILVGKDPDGFEYPVFDGRGRVRIKSSRIRFHHGFTVRRLCQDGLMPWPSEPVVAPAVAAPTTTTTTTTTTIAPATSQENPEPEWDSNDWSSIDVVLANLGLKRSRKPMRDLIEACRELPNHVRNKGKSLTEILDLMTPTKLHKAVNCSSWETCDNLLAAWKRWRVRLPR